MTPGSLSRQANAQKRVYLSGPMSGRENFNFDTFNSAAKWLRKGGYHDIFNPADQGWGGGDPETGEVSDAEYLEFMREDIRQVASADMIVMLPGWQESRGATFELDVAKRLGLEVWFLGDLDFGWALSTRDWMNPEKDATRGETVLQEADRIVSRSRGAVYGHPLDDFSKVSGMARALWGRGPETAEEHAIYMVLVKLARLQSTPGHHDSIVDVAGYMKTYDMVIAERVRRSEAA